MLPSFVPVARGERRNYHVESARNQTTKSIHFNLEEQKEITYYLLMGILSVFTPVSIHSSNNNEERFILD
jgi:hypothetical protein